MPIERQEISRALRHLRKHDTVMRTLIDEVGTFQLRLQTDRFGTLVRSILGQQISATAARTIHARLQALAGDAGITANRLCQLDIEALRSVGLSARKASYVLDLSSRVRDGQLPLRTIGRLSDEAVIEKLIQVRGIGVWTAQMFLIFSLGRLDVFPHDDLGVRTAIRNRYQLDELPTRQTSCEIASVWRPYASVASWYCWRSLDISRQTASAD